MTEKPKLLIILSYPKSGSTVLGELIGNEVNEFLHIGEMERLWYSTEHKKSLYPLKDCSCGERLKSCSFWKPYLNKIVEKIEEINKTQNLNLDNGSFLNFREEFLTKNKLSGKEVEIYTDIINTIYKTVSTVEQKIILDSSKELWYAKYLESTELFDISYIHLVRDLERVVYSRQKKLKKYNSKTGKISLSYKYMIYDIFKWNLINYKIYRFLSDKKSMFVHHADIVKSPQDILKKVAKLYNIDLILPKQLIENREFYINENHLIHGNRFRKQRGLIQLKMDNRPLTELTYNQKKILKFCTIFKFPELK